MIALGSFGLQQELGLALVLAALAGLAIYALLGRRR